MDDQQTYLLNGLLTRHFGLGRIVRFRNVKRGRQAETFELFTAQEREYLALLYPPTYAAQQLEFAAHAVNAIDGHRFSVVPFLKSKQGFFAAEGPQNTHLLVSIAPAGSSITIDQITEHDVSQIGLRLAWMHRLLKEQLPAAPPPQEPLEARVRRLMAARPAPENPFETIGPLLSQLKLPAPQGWVHGDIQLPALLHDADHQIRTVMDWGLLHHGCPLEDLVDAFLFLSTSGPLPAAGVFDTARGKALLEAYDTLLPIKRMPWTPVVASWVAQRLIDHHEQRRPLPPGFARLIQSPERLSTALASCI